MRPRPAALAARLAPLRGRLAVIAAVARRRRLRDGRRHRDRHGLRLGLEGGRAGLEIVLVHLLHEPGVLAALVLRLALLDDREERRRDEDRRVRTGGDADEDRE